MASAPSEPRPILGRVDSAGRLVAADPELAALQAEAGSHVGSLLALPQIAAIARLSRKLGIPVARRAMAAGAEHDVDLWVRAVPDGDEIALAIEKWTFRPPTPQRLDSLVSRDEEVEVEDSGGAWMTDEQLRLISVSPGLARLLAVKPGEAVGQTLTRLFHLDENESGELPMVSALAARRDFSGQCARSRGKKERRLILSGRVVVGPDGSFAGFSGRAEPAETVPEDAAPKPAISIDDSLDEALRWPIDRIIDSAESIAECADGPLRNDYAAYASDISTAARHLLAVIRSMNGDHGHDQDRINLTKLAGEAVVLLEAAAEEKRVAIALEPVAPLIARGERAGVIQILVNLIGNAVRHTPAGGAVTVSFDAAGDTVTVNVSDDGPGIAPADQQRIFERFEQASDANGGGVGLGLAISRRLARSMGGDIRLESAPGEGARFSLSLPSA